MNVALPVISHHFQASASEASWLILSYLLVTTILTLAIGRWTDVVGLRRLYLHGLLVFTVASLAAGFAPTAESLIALRVLQAAGAAAVITNTTALLADAFPARGLGLALGLNATIISVAQVLGPLVGGLAATLSGWRGVFWLNVPLGIICLFWAARSLRATAPAESREPYDLVGALLSLCVVGFAVTALSQGGALGWGAPTVLACAGSFVIGAPVLLWWLRRTPSALIDIAVIGDRARGAAYATAFCIAACRGAIVLVVSLYVQAAHGGNALQAGIVIVPMAGGIMLVAPLAGFLASRVTAPLMPVMGCLVMCGGLITLGVVLTPEADSRTIAAALLAVGVGSGIASVPNASFIVATAPTGRLGVANGLRVMLANTGYVVGTALCLGIATSALGNGEKAMAYAGETAQLSEPGLAAFTGGCRAAALALAVIAASGAVMSALRRSDSAVAAS